MFCHLFSNLEGQHLCFLGLGLADCKVALFAIYYGESAGGGGGGTHLLSLSLEDLAWLSMGQWVGGLQDNCSKYICCWCSLCLL